MIALEPYSEGMRLVFTICTLMIDAETMDAAECWEAQAPSYSNVDSICIRTAPPIMAQYLVFHNLNETHIVENWRCEHKDPL